MSILNKKLNSTLKVSLFKTRKLLIFRYFVQNNLIPSQYLLTQINTPYANEATNSTTKIKYKKGNINVKASLSLISAGILSAFTANASDLVISGVIDGPLSGGVPKAVELYVVNDIADLSQYGIGSANNGGGSDGEEFTFPSQSVTAGSYLYVASETEGFTAFFGNAPDFETGSMGINGDDAVELFHDGGVIDTFGDINTDGSGTAWEYLDGWAYRNTNATANNGSFVADNWTFSGINALDGASDNASATTPFPAETFTTEGGGEVVTPPEAPVIVLGECSAEATLLSAIQGEGDASAEVGNGHIIEAVITGFRADGFFVQEELVDMDDNDATSEGIFVKGSTDLNVNDVIRLYGDVKENFGMTTIEMDDDVQSIECGVYEDALVTAITMPYSGSLENVEGMIVEVTDATVTSTANLWQYGEIVVSDAIKRQPSDVAAPLSDEYAQAEALAEASLLTIEDNSGSRYPDAVSFFPDFSYANPIRIGDTVSAVGPLNYSFGTFRVNPTEIIAVNTVRDATPTLAEGNLSIATFNVLNYFNGQVTDTGEVTFDYDNNRGARSGEAFALQQSRIVAALVALNADVVGLMEIENDGFADDSAIAALVAAVNSELSDEDQYTFVATSDESAIGTDAITVGLLYRASVVTPSGDAIIVDMPEQQIDENRLARMRPSLVQAFTHVASDKTFAVAVNHFKSKGGSCAEDRLDTTSASDVIQGSCNALRVSASVTLGEALSADTLPERIVILGDLNAYSAEDPVAVLTDYTPENRGYTIQTAINTGMNDGAAIDVEASFGYHNLAESFDEGGFSYWFFGSEQVGSLDHVLASDAMLENAVDGTHWNINSIEAYQLQYDQALRFYPDEDGYAFTDVGPFRSSDHDPFIATFNLEADAPVVEAPEEDDNDSGGSMGFILGLMAVIATFRRRIRAKA